MKTKPLSIALALTLAFASAGLQAKESNPQFDALVIKNSHQFHVNFSNGDFDKNGPLVSEFIYVDSNNARVIGRQNFVDRIARYHTPFPELKIHDKLTIIDGNEAALNIILQGEAKGQFGDIPATGNKMDVSGAEFFQMDKKALMYNLITIEPIGKMAAQVKGDIKVDAYQSGKQVPIKKKDAAFKARLYQTMLDYLTFYNAREWGKLEGLLADNVKVNWNGAKEDGKAAIVKTLKQRLTAFPDLYFQLDRKVAQGDWGAISYTMNGAQTGPFMEADKSIPASGKHVQAREAEFFQVDDNGKIVNIIGVSDANEFVKQVKK